jgi:hypothetical protein
MQESNLPRLKATLSWAASALAACFGVIGGHARFGRMGAAADFANSGDRTHMRRWLLRPSAWR